MPLIPAADSDLDAVAALVNSAYRGETSRAGWTTEADYLDGQRTDAATLRADLAESPGAALLTLREEPDGPILGTVWLEPAQDGAWYLGMLTVDPQRQNSGLGRQLLEAAEGYARDHFHCSRAEMTVIALRTELIAWYERRGYARTGEVRPFPYDDQRFGVPRRDDLAFIVMEKRF